MPVPVDVRPFDVRTVRRPAQRTSRSPSQGRRPWWLPPPPRPAQRANRSTNRAGIERNGWPVGPVHVIVGPTRPAGPGWENGWPLGPQDACAPPPAPQPTPAECQRVAGGRAKRPPPVHPPPQRLHPEGGARKREQTTAAWPPSPTGPPTVVCVRVREAPNTIPDPAGGFASRRVL